MKVALYYDIHRSDSFEDVAQRLFLMVQKAIEMDPGGERWLFLDIEPDIDPESDHGWDVREILFNFIPQVLGAHLARFPVGGVNRRGYLWVSGWFANPKQNDDLPPGLQVQGEDGQLGDVVPDPAPVTPWPPVVPDWVKRDLERG